jgi:two-component system NtrC family sensor kinase
MNLKSASFKHLLPCLLILISLSLSAQKKERVHIDSLLSQLPVAGEDTNKFNLLISLGDGYTMLTKTDTGVFYFQKALLLAGKLKWTKGMANAYYWLGWYYFVKRDYGKSQTYLTGSVDKSFKIGDDQSAYRSVVLLTGVTSFQRKYPGTISILASAAEALKKNGNTQLQVDTYVLMGNFSQSWFDYSGAVEYYDKALKLQGTVQHKYLASYNVSAIAGLYLRLHQADKARALLMNAAAAYQKAGDQPGIATVSLSLGYYAETNHDYAGAIAYYKRAIQISAKIDDKRLQSESENDIAWEYFLHKDYNKAYIHAKLAADYAKGLSFPTVYALSTLGSIYREAPDSVIAKAGLRPGRRYEKSVALLKGAINRGKRYDDIKFEMDNLKELSLTYEKMGCYADAFKTYRYYVTKKDSTDSLKHETAIVAKEAQVNYSRKEDSLKYQQNITNGQLKQKKQQSYFFIAGIAGLLILSLFIGLNYYNQRKSNKLLTEANDQVTNANHDLSEQREEIATQRNQLADTVTHLKAAQQQLIQTEKMASLGELTAGIAHEIQNPLNFVNNFSEVNREMVAELKEALQAGDIAEALVIACDLGQNEEKINHHGKRADSIVKGMLEHSRTGIGRKELTDLNKLTDEYLRLAYHGLRAKDKNFSAELVTGFDAGLPPLNVVPQELGRVLLNLFNNAFYAVNQKQKTAGPGYKPEVTVMTASEKGNIVIKVKDNGNGIPGAIKEKIMQPFFTTKPTGEGTGLGLSLSYDIVVKGHGGTINVETKEGEYTEFIINFPFLKLT